MSFSLGDRIFNGTLTRRDFFWLATAASVGPAVSSCAVNPVTGEKEVMLVSEGQEIQIDQQHSPHQFSADYGAVQDGPLNQYISKVGHSMDSRSHRTHMPYSYRAVNANYVNAYAFPGGSIALTRGILLEMENEAELAALLGHEIGHVNARHSAKRQTKGQLVNIALAGSGLAIGSQEHLKKYAPIIQGLGSMGAGALLASYSRDNEREADSLGMEYMTRAEQNPQGMVGLMDMLRSKSKHKPSALEMMFATHPMSDERYQNAVANTAKYGTFSSLSMGRERYMDNTARLRSKKPAIESLQKGEQEMGQHAFQKAESHFRSALKSMPFDYTGLVLMAKCQLAQDKPKLAKEYVDKAKAQYPAEAQAQHLAGITLLQLKQPEAALQAFNSYEKNLPGNPNTLFYKAVSLESLQKKDAAAQTYYQYLQQVRQGEQAQHAYQRLVDWEYIKPTPQQK